MKRIALLGPGTFSEESTQHVFGTDAFQYVTFKSIEDVFRAVVDGDSDYSVIPIENTIEGTVRNHLDYLVHEIELPILAEWVYPIRMNLLGLPAGGVTTDDPAQ